LDISLLSFTQFTLITACFNSQQNQLLGVAYLLMPFFILKEFSDVSCVFVYDSCICFCMYLCHILTYSNVLLLVCYCLLIQLCIVCCVSQDVGGPTPKTPDWLHQWTRLNVARGILAMTGWFVVCLWLRTDHLSKSLLKANDDILRPDTATRRLETTEGNGNLWSTTHSTG